jgi:hypothetical protein
VLRKIVEAGAHLKSYELAARMLDVLAEVSISGRHVGRLVQQIGDELRGRRDQQTEDYVHHRRQRPSVPVPQAVAVSVDGGRILTRQAQAGRGPGVHEHGWKEDKVACLHDLQGPRFATDPHPQPPRCFLDSKYVDELVRDFHAQHGLQLPEVAAEQAPSAATGGTLAPDPAGAALSAAPAEQAPSAATGGTLASDPAGAALRAAEEPCGSALARGECDWPPERLVRSCVATMADSAAFAKMVAAEAHARNFFAAERRAFLGDGQHYNWTIQEKWFADFVPITDFVHPLSYLYGAASAVAANGAERWQCYVRWMTACWQGRVAEVLAELQAWQQRRGPLLANAEAASSDPQAVLGRTRTYLENNAARMDYPRYRQQGLPVTSAAVESLIKEFNYRVKGTEKFWNHPEGAEAILQIRAAVLSDDGRLEEYLKARPGSPYRYRRRPETGEAGEAA